MIAKHNNKDGYDSVSGKTILVSQVFESKASYSNPQTDLFKPKV